METLAVIAILAAQFLGWSQIGGSTSDEGVSEQSLLASGPALDPIGSGRLGDDPRER